jgi:hypothetical protein
MLDAPTLESFRKAVEDSIPVLQKLITKAPQVPMKAKRCKQRRRKPETPKTISDIKFSRILSAFAMSPSPKVW